MRDEWAGELSLTASFSEFRMGDDETVFGLLEDADMLTYIQTYIHT